MQHVYNISISERAANFLKDEQARSKPGPGDLLTFGFISRFVNKDGSTVEGFRPGYMASPLPAKYVSERYLVAHLPDGTVFYFLAKFAWDPDRRYLVDLDGFMFSIAPV